MLFVNILLRIAAAVLLSGVIGEKDEHHNQNVKIAFVAVCFLIFALNKML